MVVDGLHTLSDAAFRARPIVCVPWSRRSRPPVTVTAQALPLSSAKLAANVRHMRAVDQEVRHYDNTLLDYDGNHFRPDIRALEASLAEVLNQVARARHSGDPTVFTGTSGIAYMLMHIARANGMPTSHNVMGASGRMLAANWLERALSYSRSAVADMRSYSTEQFGTSLHMGHAGALAVAAAVTASAAELRERQGGKREAALLRAESADAVRQFNALLSLVVSPFCPHDELLYGRAGYLLAALVINQHCGPNAVPHQNIQYVIDALLRSGRRQASKLQAPHGPLHYRWPPGRGAEPYLGVAHGLAGVLYVLLCVRGLLQRSTRRELEAALEVILALECDEAGVPGPGGHYPTLLEPEQGRVPLVHWCHGAAGAAFLFAKAYQEMPRQVYLDAALRAGDTVWRRGLLRKGPGLCHGVAGSGYALLALYRATRDKKHLWRATQVAHFMCGDEFRQQWTVPDHPFSLYEGVAGAACLLSDLRFPDTSAMPLFELRPSSPPSTGPELGRGQQTAGASRLAGITDGSGGDVHGDGGAVGDGVGEAEGGEAGGSGGAAENGSNGGGASSGGVAAHAVSGSNAVSESNGSAAA